MIARPMSTAMQGIVLLTALMTSGPGCKAGGSGGGGPGERSGDTVGGASPSQEAGARESGVGEPVVDRAGESAASAKGMKSGEPGASGSPEWHYTFRPDAAFTRFETRVCFENRVPAKLDAQMPASRWSLLEARRVPSGSALGTGGQAPRGQRLTQAVDGVDLSELEPGDCVIYVLDMVELQRRAASSRQVRKHGEDLFLSPDFWLWKPSGPRDDVLLSASFELPEGMNVVVPWPRMESGSDPSRPWHGARYRIPESTFEAQIYGAFGGFATRTIELDGGASKLRVHIMGDSFSTATQALLMKWLEDSGKAVAAFYGRFPVSEVPILLRPVRGNDVAFGSVAKGGGVAIQLLCGVDIDAAELDDDWVAVHEMLHLGMPMLDGEGAWLREGLATYLEPIVRVRAGLLDADRAWERLHDGFQRGSARGSGRTLRQESRDMRKTREYWRVYWAGAAIALLTDVALRQRGRSIDDEVRAMRDAFVADPGREWTVDDLLAEVATGAMNLQTVAGKYLESSDFPDPAPAYRALGLAFDRKGELRSVGDEQARSLRGAITARP